MHSHFMLYCMNARWEWSTTVVYTVNVHVTCVNAEQTGHRQEKNIKKDIEVANY